MREIIKYTINEERLSEVPVVDLAFLTKTQRIITHDTIKLGLN